MTGSDLDALRAFRHDVRSPLNSVLGFALLLENELEGDQLESIRHVRRSAEEILALVDDLSPERPPTTPPPPTATADPDPAVADADACRVVLVEDNRSNIRLVERVLAHRPEVTLVALHDEEELRGWLADAAAASPALVLLDRHVGALDALSLLPQIRATHPTTPVIVVTADATEIARDEALIAGAVDVLTKPFSVAGLLEVVDAQLSSSSSSGSNR